MSPHRPQNGRHPHRRRHRKDRVAEPALLAQLLEQPRRHAAAERGRTDLRRIGVGVAIAGAPKASATWVCSSGLAPLAAGEIAAGASRPAAAGSRRASNCRSASATQLPRGRHRRPPRRSCGRARSGAGEKPAIRRARSRATRSAGPRMGRPERLLRIGRLLQPVEDDVVGRVGRRRSPAGSRRARARGRPRSNSGFDQDVGQDVERQRPRRP